MAIGLKTKRSGPPEQTSPPPDIAAAPAEEQASPPLPQAPIPHRAVRRAMVRMIKKSNVVHMILVVLISLVALIYLLSLFRTGTGSFTISLARADMYKYGIELSDTVDFTASAEVLEAAALKGATNISINDLPTGLDLQDGSHNGDNYIAYTFYVRNSGKVNFDYRYSINLVEQTQNLDNALRLEIYYNGGESRVFAKRAADGTAEPDTIPFVSDTIVDAGSILGLEVGAVDKYTVVIWIEGDDPECLDDLLGGVVKMNMKIEVTPGEEQ